MSELEINKYQRGKIYKLINTVNDEVYVGSTYQKLLSKRMGKHREDALVCTSPIYKLMNEIGIDKFYIELIMHYPCNSKDELIAKERQWIKQIGTLNKRIEGRTKKEYREENKDALREKAKVYRENNTDILKQRKHEYYEKHKEQVNEKQKAYVQKHLDDVKARQLTYRAENKDAMS